MISNPNMEAKVKKVLELMENTPNGVVVDADTILADLIEHVDMEETTIAAELLKIWEKSEDRASVDQLFCLLTDCTFEDYLDMCIAKTTQAPSEAAPADETAPVAESEGEPDIPKVKVLIYGGIVTNVLSSAPVDVEIIDDDKDYEDHDQLDEYGSQLMADPSLKDTMFSTARFCDEDDEEDEEEDD